MKSSEETPPGTIVWGVCMCGFSPESLLPPTVQNVIHRLIDPSKSGVSRVSPRGVLHVWKECIRYFNEKSSRSLLVLPHKEMGHRSKDALTHHLSGTFPAGSEHFLSNCQTSLLLHRNSFMSKNKNRSPRMWFFGGSHGRPVQWLHAAGVFCPHREAGGGRRLDLVERCWPAQLHLELKAPEASHKCSSLPEGLSSIHTVSTTITCCFSSTVTDMMLDNQWDWCRPTVSTAPGPHHQADAMRWSGLCSDKSPCVEMPQEYACFHLIASVMNAICW